FLATYLEARPQDANGWHNLALVASQQGSLEKAADAWQQALKLKPDHPPSRAGLDQLLVSRVSALLQQGAPAQALALLDQHAASPSALLLDARAAVQHRLGKGDDAITLSRRAVALAPGNARLRANLAALLCGQTDPEMISEAERLASELLQQRPDHPGANHCLAVVCRKTGRLADAARYAAAAVQSEPTVEHWLTLGDVLAELDPQRGIGALKQAVTAHPQASELYRQLGIAQLRAGQANEGLTALDQALSLDPADQRSIAHRAVAMMQTGRGEEAVAWLGQPAYIRQVTLACPPAFADLAAFNIALANDIARHSRMRWEPVGLAARNGGLTDDLTADQTPAIQGFEASLRAAISEMIACRPRVAPFEAAFPGEPFRLNIWATLVHAGGNIDTHIHEDSWLSGAYYVQLPPGTGTEGAIEFGRPHADLPQLPESEPHVIQPREGQLLLFPSYLFHRTLPHQHDTSRISVSFDVSPAL
ncbi:MAG: putative 2OG-Fe(II) oxygenase, partial [Pseudomonadota bacterium]